jgi:hypothetical protein
MASEIKCPKCGNRTLNCQYLGDVGGIDYLDRYKAKCSLCGFEEVKDVSGGSPLNANWPTNCPFCGKQYCSD